MRQLWWLVLLLLAAGGAAAPLAADEAPPASIAPKEQTEGVVDLANALEPDDCVCCERSQAAMTRYCAEQMVRGPHYA